MSSEPSQLPQPPAKRNPFRGLGIMLVIALLAAVAYFYGPTAVDAVRATQYTPSADMATIDKRIDLTQRAQQIFYATSPEIDDRSQFNANCQSTERTAAVLGCYVHDQIYLYNVQDVELDGAMEVTAAHELLHAAYARLNVFEQAHVNKMVNAEYAKIKNNPVIAQAMQYYSTAEPGEEVNELHSIIGTTVKDLPPDLEQYYSQYFTNRAAIVAMNAQYTAVFDKLNAEATALQTKITSESATIKAETLSYNADLSQLNTDIESFNSRAANGGFSSQYSFNQARSALLERIQQMTDRQVTLNAEITTYNADVAAYNKLAVRAKQLNESINGVEAPNSI